MHRSIWLGRAAGMAAVFALAGCSGDGGSYATVSGKITHEGTPVAEAKVTFTSTTTQSGGGRDEYYTNTNSSGEYLIAAVGNKPGIPPGMYKVTVVKLVMKPGVAIPEDFDQVQLEASGMGENKLPREYASPETTKLEATLEAGKNQDKNFDLKGKAGKK